MRTARVLPLVALLSLAVHAGAQSAAEVLRGATKPIALAGIPDDYRAVTLGGGADGFPWFLMGAFGGRTSSRPADQLLLKALSAVWVQPDEFAELLDGKRPRLRGYRLDFSALAASSPKPVLTFNENWLEAGRIVTWTPAPELTKASLASAVAQIESASGGEAEETVAEAASAEPGTLTPIAGEATATRDTTARLSALKQIALATIMFAQDNDERFPDAQASSILPKRVGPYLKDATVFNVSVDGGRVLYNTHLSGVGMASIERISETLLLWEERAWPDGKRSVAFADGHVKRLTEAQWKKSWKDELARRVGRTVR